MFNLAFVFSRTLRKLKNVKWEEIQNIPEWMSKNACKEIVKEIMIIELREELSQL